MQLLLIDRSTFDVDLSDKRVMVSLSGGINSAAVLCYLASEYPPQYRPKEIWLFYAHLREHSPGTGKFVCDQIRYAKKHFEQVTWKIARGSVLRFFEQEKFIPHPMLSPCSDHLKRIPAAEFMAEHKLEVDLVGYVRHEQRRVKKAIAKNKGGAKHYPISHYSDEDCFDLVMREIGWYPSIYDIKENGRRIFKHNNCLPCKNFEGFLSPAGDASDDYAAVKKYFPEYHDRAVKLSEKVGGYWGREPDFDGHCSFCEFS